jgi:NAD(P)-dependent dehydrogenase (short-subunit alcohol dehydrogenase family)
MKVVLVGATGTVGKHVLQSLVQAKHEVIKVGKSKGDFQINLDDPESIAKLYKSIGQFDAVANASGDVAFAPFKDIKQEQWLGSFRSKLLGQINLVQLALPYINAGGSFTLISGILGEEQIAAGTIAATVNKALEGFVKSAACELPKNLRINLVSPTVLEDSMGIYGDYFPGFKPVDGKTVGEAFKRSILGVQTGKVFSAQKS